MPAGTFLPPGLTTSDVKITSGGTDNYVMTAVDGETIQGEDNLTFDGSTLTVDGAVGISGDLTLSAGADGALRFSVASSIKILDNSATALVIEEADNAYMTFVTTNSSEAITIAKATTFSGGIANSGTIAAGTWNGTDIEVAYGGTGASTLTDGGILLGSGTNPITAMAVLTDGQMIVGDGTTDPVAESGTVLRTSIGVGTGDSPQFTNLTLTGDLAVNGTDITSTGALTLNPATNFNVTLTANYSQAMIWNDGATNIYYLDTRDTTPALITHYIKSQNVVLADAANAVHQAFEIGTYNVTLAGQTTVSTPQRTVNIEATQILQTGGVVAVTEAVTFRIAGAPYGATDVTITNPYAMKVQSGTSLFNGNVDLNNTGTLLNVGASGNDWTASLLTLQDSSLFKIGATSAHGTTAGTNLVSLFNGTAPAGTLSNGASFFCASGEMKVIDAAGNITVLSPHDDEGRWIYHSQDSTTGKVLHVHMEKLMRRLDKMFGGGFIEEFIEE